MSEPIRKMRTAARCLAFAIGTSQAHAEGLVDIYQLAQSRDAAYESARYQLEAVRTLNQQARGVLFPSIDLRGGVNRSWLEVESDPVALPGPPGAPAAVRYIP